MVITAHWRRWRDDYQSRSGGRDVHIETLAVIEAPSHDTFIDWIVGSAAPGARLDRRGEAGQRRPPDRVVQS